VKKHKSQKGKAEIAMGSTGAEQSVVVMNFAVMAMEQRDCIILAESK
jgi:hypothetical protein